MFVRVQWATTDAFGQKVGRSTNREGIVMVVIPGPGISVTDQDEGKVTSRVTNDPCTISLSFK